MRIFDFRWDDEKKTPYFETLENGKKEKKFIKRNEKISITLTDETPICVGSIQNGSYVPCPTNEVGQKKCEICKKAEDFFPCQFCNGFNCNRFREKKIENCDADHMVYLALFNSDLVKVGVSRISRGKARQFEQGSHFTKVFASGINGIMARRIETTLTKAGFPDKIPASQKKYILLPGISEEEGRKTLDKKFEFAKEQIMAHMPEMIKYLTEDTFWNMLEYYSDSFYTLEKSQLPIHIEKIKQDESIGGTLKAVKGSFLLIETPTEIAAISAKDFIGKDISFASCPDGITKQGGFQGAMF